MATSVGSHPLAPTADSLVAVALRLRGADPSFLFCDGALPACEACTYIAFPDPFELVEHGPQRRLCPPCFASGRDYCAPLPIPLLRYRDYLRGDDASRAHAETSAWTLEECFSFERDGLKLGEQARASVFRYFGKVDLATEPETLPLGVARRYAAGALVAAAVAERVLLEVEPEVVVAHHGVYVPQGVLGEVARRAGVRLVNWGPAYRSRTLIYSHGDTYHHTLIDEPESQWDRPLEEEQEAALLQYLADRRGGGGDWTWVTADTALEPGRAVSTGLAERLGVDPSRPTFGLLTNVLWDAQLYYDGNAFADMLEWLWTTIEYFERRPDLQLIVRIHPHEVKAGNRQPLAAEIERRYRNRLPANIKIVRHDDPLNTYALMDLCNAVLIYGTKTGVELAPLGVPVVVAGDAWMRRKGLTHDASTPEEYAALLDRLETLPRLDADTTARARRYAYHYFFRRMIPLTSLADTGVPPDFAFGNLAELQPGNDPGLDVVCSGILDGAPFVFDAR